MPFDANDLIQLSTLFQIQPSHSLWPWGLKQKNTGDDEG